MPSIALPVSLRGQLLSGSRFSPLSLFTASEPGLWYDPSDLTTMFQDTAGTTPVTTPGQSVGLVLDKSKNGVGTNGAARRNLLPSGYSEQLNNTAGWFNGGTVNFAPNSIVAPDGTMTGDKAVPLTGINFAVMRQNITQVVGNNVLSIYGKFADTDVHLEFYLSTGSTGNVGAVFNLATGEVLVAQGCTTNVGSPDPNGWRRYEVRWNETTAKAGFIDFRVNDTGTRGAQVTGNGVKGLFLWGAQLETSPTATAYQKLAADWVSTMPGNHATQATAASRPTYGIVPLGGRRNLLLATDTMATQSLTVAAVAHTLSFTGTGTVTLTGASIAGPLVGTGASNRVSLTFTPTAASLTLTVVGSVTLAQLELGSTATAYQRVGTTFDVTEAGVQSLSYLFFDGVDDFLVTSTITPGTDKVQVFAGVRKLTDAATGVVAEYSAIINSNNGTFLLAQISGSPSSWQFLSKGTLIAGVGGGASAAPQSNVLTGLGDISGDVSTLRRNGAVAQTSAADQGTGNFLAYPIYIGRRGGVDLPLNGDIYGLIVRFGSNLDAGAIKSTETFVNEKTGAY